MRKANTQIFRRRNLLKEMVIIDTTTMGDFFTLAFSWLDFFEGGYHRHSYRGWFFYTSL